MREDFGIDDENMRGEEVEFGAVEAENRQAEDPDNVIEMVQEDGLPVEEKRIKQKSEYEAEDQREEKPAFRAKTKKPIRKATNSRKIFGGIMVVAALALLVGGSVMAGAFWQRKESADNLANSGNVTEEELLGGGGGVPLKNVALLPSNDKLVLAFLKMHNDGNNSCYSPLSVRYALEMLREGASGETRAQIDSLLGDNVATRHENVAEHLSLANSLWVASTWQDKIQESYKKTLQEKFDAEVKVDDFRSAANINNWIEMNTLGLLKNAFADEDVHDLNAALVNVLAIDMNWERQFMKELTFGGYFDFEEKDYDEENLYTTMKRWGGEDIYYNLAADATVLAMDLKEYDETKLQFVAIMPEDLKNFVEKVSNEDINRLLSGLRMAEGQNDTYNFSFTAYIPKFEIKNGGVEDLVEDLRGLGVVDAFDVNKADFSKIVGEDEPFAIDAATHKTKFDFSEEGIRAAAVTLLGGLGAQGGPGPIPSSVDIVVSINRPFMYLVRDVRTGEIWFIGTVYEPNKWADEKANYGSR